MRHDIMTSRRRFQSSLIYNVLVYVIVYENSYEKASLSELTAADTCWSLDCCSSSGSAMAMACVSGLGHAVSAELIVARLQQQLREKELKLTDIQLEALTSAHQLDHLRDAMNRMQVSRLYTWLPVYLSNWQCI